MEGSLQTIIPSLHRWNFEILIFRSQHHWKAPVMAPTYEPSDPGSTFTSFSHNSPKALPHLLSILRL
jgi:hypothetical protein